jgi:hypothetical protein
MRKSTRALITACAGLVAGAAFGATPALAGPGWWPPGHVAGYHSSFGACTSYASTLVLWDDDYDCDYWPQRVATPYALVIQRPVLIPQQILVTQPGHDDDEYEYDEDEYDYQKPVDQKPADPPMADQPMVEEPPGNALTMVPADQDKTVTKVKAVKAPAVKSIPAVKSTPPVKPAKAIKKVKPAKAIKDQTQAHVMAHNVTSNNVTSNHATSNNVTAHNATAHDVTYSDEQCVDVVATCTDVSVVAVAHTVPVVPVVPVVHHPFGGAWHHPWY